MATYQTLTFQDGSVLTAGTSTVSFLGTDYTLDEQQLATDQTIGVDIGAGIEPVGVQRVRRAASLLGASYTQNEVRLVPTSSRAPPDRFHTFEYENQALFEEANAEDRTIRGAAFRVTELRIDPDAEHAARIKPGGKNKAGAIRYDIDRR